MGRSRHCHGDCLDATSYNVCVCVCVCVHCSPLLDDTVLARSLANEFMAWRRALVRRGPGLDPLAWEGLSRRRLEAGNGENEGDAVRSRGRLVLLIALDSSFSSYMKTHTHQA